MSIEKINELNKKTAKLAAFLDTVDWKIVEKTEADKQAGFTISEIDIQYCNNALVSLWELASLFKSYGDTLEKDLRLRIVAFDFNNAKKKGTETFALSQGWSLKCTKGFSYSFAKNSQNKTDKAAIERALQDIENTGPEGKYIADNLVNWSPDLSVSAYDKLSDEHRTIIDPVLVKKDKLPTLELIEPKSK